MGSKVVTGICSPSIFCFQTSGGDDPKPWPRGSNITAICSSDVHRFVKLQLEIALAQWLKYVVAEGDQLTVKFISDGPADIRFSMGSGPTRCALGVLAQKIPQGKPTAVLGLRNWWAQTGTVWDQRHILRMALHLWGHALGM